MPEKHMFFRKKRMLRFCMLFGSLYITKVFENHLCGNNGVVRFWCV